MEAIAGATIRLKSGERIDAYILVNGQLVQVQIESAEADSVMQPGVTEHERLLVPEFQIEPIELPGGRGQTANMADGPSLILYSEEFGVDVGEALRAAAVEGQGAGHGRFVINVPFDSEISFGMKDLDGIGDG
jgi:hypothetical protein